MDAGFLEIEVAGGTGESDPANPQMAGGEVEANLARRGDGIEANPERESGEVEANPARGGGEAEPEPAAARIAELTGQLASLRAESERQLADLRVETDRQLMDLRAESAARLAAYTDLARALPGLVPELVGGADLVAVQGSVATAREAYNRIAANLLTPAAPGDERSFGPPPGAGGGARSDTRSDTRNDPASGGDQPAKLATGRGVNLIYQALAGGANGNLAR
jgi:hypothetical protein